MGRSAPVLRGKADRAELLVARLAALAIFAALVMSACGASGSLTGTPPPSAAVPSVAAQPGQSPAGESATTSEGPRAGGAVDCEAVRHALEVQNLNMQLLFQATSDAQWKALLDPQSPIPANAKAYSEAIETIATLPGASGVIGTFREIAAQFRMAATSGKPYSDGSGIGASLYKLVSDNFVTGQAALSTAWEESGCK
jgi:hypothetical protein